MSVKKNTKTTTSKKGEASKYVGTSVTFLRENLDFLKNHELRTEKDVTISWIINRLIEKLRDGTVTLIVD